MGATFAKKQKNRMKIDGAHITHVISEYANGSLGFRSCPWISDKEPPLEGDPILDAGGKIEVAVASLQIQCRACQDHEVDRKLKNKKGTSP